MRPLFDLPDHWPDEEALLVFEFIDEIRDQIWHCYSLQIQSAARLTRRVNITLEEHSDDNGQTDLFDDQIQF